jgi:hypothetical protein
MLLKATFALIMGAVALAAAPAAAQADPREIPNSGFALNCGATNLLLAERSGLDYRQRQWHAERANMWLNLYMEKTGRNPGDVRADVLRFITNWLGDDVADGYTLSPEQTAQIERERQETCSRYGG